MYIGKQLPLDILVAAFGCAVSSVVKTNSNFETVELQPFKKDFAMKRNQKLLSFFCLFAMTISVSYGFYAYTAHADDDINLLRSQSRAFVKVAKKVTPAVVHIASVREVNARERQQFDMFRRFFDRGRPRGQNPHGQGQNKKYRKQQGFGSGVIVSDDGYILTNNHVVAKADEVTVTLGDKRTAKAKIVGTDKKTDIAVLKIDLDNIPVAPLGNSDKLEVGEWVLAIGNPFGLSQTVTAGIVSAKGRASVGIVEYEDFIQTDAAINPGNSGGPLVNLDGEVVGINTAIYSKTGGYQGIGFTIPVKMVKNVMRQIIATGKVQRGWLGVQISDINPDMAEAFGLPETTGALVNDVSENGPAAQGGLISGDIVLSLDNQLVDSSQRLKNLVASIAAGTQVPVRIFRKGKYKTLQITIGSLEKAKWGRLAQGTAPATSTPQTKYFEELGLELQQLTPALAKRYRHKKTSGVIIAGRKVNDRISRSTLSKGDLVLSINHEPIETISDVVRVIEKSKSRRGYLFRVRTPKNTIKFVIIKKR